MTMREWRRTNLLCGELPPLALPAPPAPGIPPERSVRLADLSIEKKRAVWGWLLVNEPDTAALLASDDVRALMDAFPGASPVLDVDTVRKAFAK